MPIGYMSDEYGALRKQVRDVIIEHTRLDEPIQHDDVARDIMRVLIDMGIVEVEL